VNTLTLITNACKEAWSRTRLVWIIYIFQLILAITIGLQVYEVIEASIGDSLELRQLIQGFNYSTIQDLINIHGASLSPLIGQMRWYILAYLFFSTFIHAGVLYVLRSGQDNWLSFWRGGATYLIQFLVIGLFFIILWILWSLIVWLPYFSNLFFMVENWTNEPLIIWILISLVIVYFIGLSFLFSWSVFSRIALIDGNLSIWKSILKGGESLGRNFASTIKVTLSFALLLILIYYANLIIEWSVGIRTELLIIVFFFIQQAIIWLKLWLRVAVYATFVQMK
jgi:hypothetical protein